MTPTYTQGPCSGCNGLKLDLLYLTTVAQGIQIILCSFPSFPLMVVLSTAGKQPLQHGSGGTDKYSPS